jgi:hypothetical protein
VSLTDLCSPTVSVEFISTPLVIEKGEELPLTSILVGFLPAATDKDPELINCLKIGNKTDTIILSLSHFLLSPTLINRYLAILTQTSF